MKNRYHLTLLLILLAPLLLGAQTRPKVGVVLSGGGAKGYAHVGALKVLEEAGVKVDYIGGTSMGAIVGGLYAAGWSAMELDSLLRSFDIQDLVADRTPRELKPFFEKQYGEKYILSLSMNDFQISLPAGISNGQMLFNQFSELTSKVRYIHDFDQLPIPFLCVATEVATGRESVIREGILPQAMLASGAFPGLFSPVEINGKLYTDGGLVNNFPAKEVRDMGADIIIGITVEDGLLQEEDLKSAPSIITQISSYRQAERSQDQYAYADLIINPNVKGFGVTSFDAVDTLIRNGEYAARQQWQPLLEIARQQQQATVVLTNTSAPAARYPKDSLTIDQLMIKSRDTALANSLFTSALPYLNGKISIAEFTRTIDRYYATGQYKNIYYSFRQTPSGRSVLEVEPIANPGHRRQFRLGLHYDDVYKTSILFNATWLDLLTPNSRTSFDLILGDRFRYDFHYVIENDRGPDFGFRSRSQFNNIDFPLPEPIKIEDLMLEQIQFNFIDVSNEFYTHLWRGANSAFGLGTEIKYFRNKNNQLAALSGFDPLTGSEGWYLTGKSFFRMDNQDDRHFPHRGVRANVEVRVIYNFSEQYTSTANKHLGFNVDLSLRAATPVSSKMTMGYLVEAGTNFHNSHVPFMYLLGSINENLINNFKPFPGLEFGQIIATAIAGGGLEGRYELFPNHHLTLGGRWSYIRDFSDFENELNHYIYGLYASYHLRTALGPVGITYGHTNVGREWYFNVGHWF